MPAPDNPGKSGAGDHAEHENARVRISLAGHEQLTSGTSARQRKGQAGHHHPRKVPNGLSVRYRLTAESGMELPESEIRQKGCQEQSQKPGEKVHLSEQNKVTQRTHGAEPAALGENPDENADPQRNGQSGVGSPGAFQAVEEHATLRLT